MPLNIDQGAGRDYAGIIHRLRDARIQAGISQDALAEVLPVRGRAVSEWETMVEAPTLENLTLWCRELDRQLVLIRPDGTPEPMLTRQRPGEAWELFQQRRLAQPLRRRRQAYPQYDPPPPRYPWLDRRPRAGMTQGDLGALVGVTRDSIRRWELAQVPPRPIALIVWAQKLGFTVALGSIDNTAAQLP